MRSPAHILILRACVLIAWFSGLANAQSIRPAGDRIDAIVSYPVVISIVTDDERELRGGVLTRLDDGRQLQSWAFWVGLSPRFSLPGWTSASGIWTATASETITRLPIERRPVGAWFIQIPIPVDAVGQGLWISGNRYELNWLPDPERTTLEAGSGSRSAQLDAFWNDHLAPDALGDPAVAAAIDQLHRDPFQNWRARLLTDGLHPARTLARDTASSDTEALGLELSMQTPGADLLGALARQHEARWQLILGRIWLIDQGVARKLKSQLMRTARFGDRILPIWDADTAGLAQLEHDLLSPYVDDQTRVLRASAWLEIQPRALAWISDDQGRIEADSGRFISTVTTLSMPLTPGASLFRIDAPDDLGSSSPELSTVEAYAASPMTIAVDPIRLAPSNPLLETQRIRIQAGRWEASREIIASATPARPPYIRIGPLLNDWTMESLLAQRPLLHASPGPGGATLGILRRTGAPSREDPTRGWELYIEAASSDPGDEDEAITLWIGSSASPLAVWTIHPDGRIEVRSAIHPSLARPRIRTRVLAGKWVAAVDLPSAAFDQDRLLQLGIERTDADGTHTAWPRRMIPDQPAPGRLAIRADNFDQLAAP